MKRVILFSPTAALSFLLGILAVFAFVSRNSRPIVSQTPQQFDVYLERIEVRDADINRWNMNGGYLSLFDAVYFDDSTILALYLQDGFRMSHDGGKTWQRLFEPSGLPKATGGFSLSGVDFLDSGKGWAFGTCLIKTEDGGQSWTKIKLPEWMDNLKVKFLNENFGYIAGRAGFCDRGGTCNTSLSVYKTVDGGKTWRKSFKTRDLDTPWDVVIVDENIAMITGGGGWLYRTVNGGRSWKTVLDRDFGRVMSISRSPDGRFWLFGTNSIRFSDDHGATWEPAENLAENIVNREWWAVDFTSEGLGVAVSEDAVIAITRDSGRSWTKAVSNLHVQDKIPVPNNPFTEQLRGIRLRGNQGIVNGGQRDYFVRVPN